ncbi:phage tail terminator-like protein [Bradyrhizobium sp. HKCCYLS2038]|uniref:phage tail terminator-like protein n=1 Tax=Bradyrhizobium sp. HKCCYLS2038 TaxID=3420764 RepID=UPI003EB79FB4
MAVVGTEAKITEALFTRLAALSPAIPTAYPNVSFPAPPAVDRPDTYLQASILRAPTQSVGIAAWDEHAGILQIDVVYKPQDGELKPLQIADSVAAWFARGTRMTNGSIQIDVYEPPQIASMMADGDRFRIPVSVRYRSFIQ